ncbi:methyltransferase domain-containing protein [Deinococcus sp. QL22]|uniref:class I SAM-dependent methyltransferase n=1 Tax=Deinococcus sp. QL22 TaxID=2939437 RepID=UPI0020176581|nr:methyltransferase domain-containing protein [Deinococcus sp. QL22]UQN08163.1 methyltransferase domain-containing protein [Deinococcus sp. QL22]
MTKSSREQFDAHAEKYASSAVHRFGASLPILLELAAPKEDDLVLDIATGTGNTALALASHVARAVGVDVSPKMLDQARARADREAFTNVSFQEGIAEHLPFADASFTLVTSRHAPHHFREVPTFLQEVHRVLRPGGRFVLADQITPRAEMQHWVDFWQRTRDPSHVRQRTVDEWREMTKAAGFRSVEERLVPYRLEFEWWTQQSGTSTETVETLREHARNADVEVREAMGLEFDAQGHVQAHHDPMLVARWDR